MVDFTALKCYTINVVKFITLINERRNYYVSNTVV